jgi:two-component system chemotaxis sensor kinase CheA
MLEINQLLHQCASSAIAATADDLPALAQLHTNIRAVRESFERSGAGGQIAKHSVRVEDLIEQLVLREVDDTQAALNEICRLIELIQVQSSGGNVEAAVSAPRSSTPTAPAPVAAARPSEPPKQAAAAETAVREPSADLTENPIGDEDAALAVEFVGEATTHLESAEGALLKLEEGPGATDVLNCVFRGFHSIKGVAGFLNLKQVGRLAHAAETLLDLARKGKLQLSGSRFDRALDALDMMKKLVAGIQIAASARVAPPIEPGLLELVERIEAEAASAVPGAASRASGPTAAIREVEPSLTFGAAPVEPETELAPPTPVAQAAAAAVEAPAQAGTTRQSAGSDGGHADNADATVKVATNRLDALIDAVGELVIAQSMVAQGMSAAHLGADPKLARNLSQLGKITRSLQDLSMAMRMVPVQGLFQKMSRLARDTARKAAKEVEFVHAGGETELDRNVVEAVGDPLVHMIRNAIDHGVEFADERQANGKPRSGRVTLRAFHQAGYVVLEIADDGRGLNRKRIVEKAIAAGVVREGQELSDEETFNLIFHPGLSTAERITDISGRGVGMDVVRRNIEALRGRIEIQSTEGKGSVFTIRLPLTLAVIDGLIVKVGAERYILPITAIEQSIRPTADQLSTVQGRGEICMIRGQLLPIVRLHRLFDVQPKHAEAVNSIAVIVHDGARRCCLLVDELVGQQQVVIKSLGEGMGHVPGIAGCAILGDGNVSLILDIGGLIKSSVA